MAAFGWLFGVLFTQRCSAALPEGNATVVPVEWIDNLRLVSEAL